MKAVTNSQNPEAQTTRNLSLVMIRDAKAPEQYSEHTLWQHPQKSHTELSWVFWKYPTDKALLLRMRERTTMT